MRIDDSSRRWLNQFTHVSVASSTASRLGHDRLRITRRDLCLRQALAITDRYVLHAPVAVMNQGLLRRLPPVQRLLQRVQYEVRSNTKSVCIEPDTRQPTILLANTSMTKATYTKPCQVET